MKNSAKTSTTEPNDSESLERLTETLNRLADEVRVAREVIDEFKTDFSWLLQNGMPHQPQEFLILNRMARDPLAEDWAERLQFTRWSIPQNEHDQASLSGDDLESLALELQSAFEGIAEGQLEIVLNALDEARQRILSAVACRETDPPDPSPAPATQNVSEPNPVPETSKQGELF